MLDTYFNLKFKLTFASWSKRPNSSFSRRTSSWAVHCDASTVKPTMSANRMLKERLILRHPRYGNYQQSSHVFRGMQLHSCSFHREHTMFVFVFRLMVNYFETRGLEDRYVTVRKTLRTFKFTILVFLSKERTNNLRLGGMRTLRSRTGQ